MLPERLNYHNLFYYISHTQSEKLDPQDRTKALVQSIFIGCITVGFAQLASLIYYSRFCQCCRVKASASLNISLPMPPPISLHVPELLSPPLLSAPPLFLSEINEKSRKESNDKGKSISDIKIPVDLAEKVVEFIGFNKTDLRNLAQTSKEWNAAVKSYAPMWFINLIQKNEIPTGWMSTYKENFNDRIAMNKAYSKLDPSYASLKRFLQGEDDPKLLEDKVFKYLITENITLLAEASVVHPEIIELISSENIKKIVLDLTRYFKAFVDGPIARSALHDIIVAFDPISHKSKDVVFAMILNGAYQLGEIDKIFWKDKDIVLPAVRYSGFQLCHVDETLREDEQVLWAAIDDAWQALQFVNKSFLNKIKREKWLAIIKEHPKAFKFLPHTLRSDEEFILVTVDAILKQDKKTHPLERVEWRYFESFWDALKFVDASLKNKILREKFIALVKKHPDVFKFLPDTVQDDKDFVQAASFG